MAFCCSRCSIISKSSWLNSLLESMMKITRSAWLKDSFDFSIPIFSMRSSVSLIPAVSVNLTGIPFMLRCSSIVSLVVPGISVTMALASLSRLFIREDFPTFGLPIIATFNPSCKIRPVSALLISPATAFLTKLKSCSNLSYVISSISSSG